MDEFKLRKIRLGNWQRVRERAHSSARHALDVADEQLERKRDKVSEGLEAPPRCFLSGLLCLWMQIFWSW